MELAKNKKAFHEFHILECFEAGIELRGTEVKSCRLKNISFNDSHARIEGGELILYNIHISPYECGNRFNHDPMRPRKLLMHSREIRKLAQNIKEKGLTIVPIKFYLKNRNVKVEVAIAKGKNQGDKRETLKKKQHDLETRRAISSAKMSRD